MHALCSHFTTAYVNAVGIEAATGSILSHRLHFSVGNVKRTDCVNAVYTTGGIHITAVNADIVIGLGCETEFSAFGLYFAGRNGNVIPCCRDAPTILAGSVYFTAGNRDAAPGRIDPVVAALRGDIPTADGDTICIDSGNLVRTAVLASFGLHSTSADLNGSAGVDAIFAAGGSHFAVIDRNCPLVGENTALTSAVDVYYRGCTVNGNTGAPVIPNAVYKHLSIHSPSVDGDPAARFNTKRHVGHSQRCGLLALNVKRLCRTNACLAAVGGVKDIRPLEHNRKGLVHGTGDYIDPGANGGQVRPIQGQGGGSAVGSRSKAYRTALIRVAQNVSRVRGVHLYPVYPEVVISDRGKGRPEPLICIVISRDVFHGALSADVGAAFRRDVRA